MGNTPSTPQSLRACTLRFVVVSLNMFLILYGEKLLSIHSFAVYFYLNFFFYFVLSLFSRHRGNSLRRLKNGAKWRVKDINIEGKSSTETDHVSAQNGLPPHQPLQDEKKSSSNRNSANLSSIDISPAQIAQANWTFIEKLLKVRNEFIFNKTIQVTFSVILGLQK
jgi:hypothetical protein